jgi:hypothetical protein
VSDHENGPKVERKADGRFAAGHAPLSNGRPKLPDWFKESGPEALKYLLGVALGTEDSNPKLRLQAAALVVDRIYGKAPETVTVEGQLAVEKIIREIVTPKAE